jgi:hypothetical protein
MDNDRAEKNIRFFIACQANQTTKVKVTEDMQVRGYSDSEAAKLALQIQLCCGIQKIKGEFSLCPKAAATHLLPTPAAAAAARPALRNITPNQAAAPVLVLVLLPLWHTGRLQDPLVRMVVNVTNLWSPPLSSGCMHNNKCNKAMQLLSIRGLELQLASWGHVGAAGGLWRTFEGVALWAVSVSSLTGCQPDGDSSM